MNKKYSYMIRIDFTGEVEIDVTDEETVPELCDKIEKAAYRDCFVNGEGSVRDIDFKEI